jgi:ubiquinone/menaquinone biosynthesis C-methylase UbiE
MSRSLSVVLACCGFALLSLGCSGLAKVDLGRVLTSGRDGWQYPERVIESLAIEPGDHVAEIGAGEGYWIPRLSEAVGRNGRVYAVEVDAERVAALERLVSDRELSNVDVVLGDLDDPRLPEASVDLAITVLTYHHIAARADYFRRLQRSLRPGGRVAHLDDRPDVGPPISWFQSEGHWSEPDEIVAEMSEAGYRRSDVYDFLPSQSFQVFRRTTDATALSDRAEGVRVGEEDGEGAGS